MNQCVDCNATLPARSGPGRLPIRCQRCRNKKQYRKRTDEGLTNPGLSCQKCPEPRATPYGVLCVAHLQEARRTGGRAARPVGSRYEVDGYVMVVVDIGKARAEHRIVLEEKLGRPLLAHESAHHINGIRNDNRPENLELWVGAIRYGQRAADIRCHHCGTPYAV